MVKKSENLKYVALLQSLLKCKIYKFRFIGMTLWKKLIRFQ